MTDTSTKPNILVVMADQLAARALPMYGNAVCKAPNLQRLAEGGTVFENAYCNFPLCVPSRASMMAGRLTPEIGVWDNACELPSSQPTIAHWLRRAGYRTMLTGKMHFIGPDQLHGFDERTVTDVYPADYQWIADWDAGAAFVPSGTAMNGVVEAGPAARTMQEDYDREVGFVAERAIFDFARDGDERPWFQIASFTCPHTPFVVSEDYWNRYHAAEIDEPRVGAIPFEELDYMSKALFFAHGRHRHDVTREHLMAARRAYYGMISFIDDRVGELLDALERSGQAENTVVLFTSDHGDMLGERGMWFKQSFHEWSSHIPLLVSLPGARTPERLPHVCSLVDVLPTLADIAGERITVEHDGASLLPLLRDEATEWRDVAICDYTGIGPCTPTRMVRRGRHKLIYTHGHPHLLYDLETDPDELRNLADDPQHGAALEELLAICMDGWDPDEIDHEVRASQNRRRILKEVGSPDWNWRARQGDERRYVRTGGPGGGVDGTKGRLRLPYVAPAPADHPELPKEEIEAVLRGERALSEFARAE